MRDKDKQEAGQRIQQRIMQSIAKQERSKVMAFRRYLSVAASIVFILGLTGLIWQYYAKQTEVVHNGENLYVNFRAGQLHLANGDSVALDIIAKGNDKLKSLAISEEEDMLLLRALPIQKEEWVHIKVDRGGFYKLILLDSSIVYINSNSKISYKGNYLVDRVISVEGEAFFEVKHQFDKGKRKPFSVLMGDNTVQVLGTSFNVLNRTGQLAKTTLVTGLITVANHTSGEIKQIKPGSQVVFQNNGSLQVNQVDLEYYTAWKDGYFYFKNQPVATILQALQSSYNFDFDVKNVPDDRLTIFLKRNRPLSDIVELIEQSCGAEIHFVGNRLFIKK